MDRAEAEAIYDSGREACVEFILELAGRVGEHEDRLRGLEEQARRDSRTSSTPPSQDPPRTRAERRAEARAKAKELMRRAGERRKAGGQSGHRGAGRELRPEDQVDEIVDHYPEACGGCGREFTETVLPLTHVRLSVWDERSTSTTSSTRTLWPRFSGSRTATP